MDTITKRISLYNYFIDTLKNYKTNFQKVRKIGSGGHGVVFEMCHNKKCMAVKKTYIDWKLADFFDDQFNSEALKEGIYIELLAGNLLTQIVLQGVSPHFAMNYAWDYKERDRADVCAEIYPYKMFHYNELIFNSETFTDWTKDIHSLKEWYNAYFQITSGIYVLQHYFNMTHFDLHADNVLVQRVKKGGYWNYKIDNVNYKVPNLGYRFFIIDLGSAFIGKKFKSWYEKQYKDNKRITRSFDIMSLFESTLEFSTSPREFKSEIRKLIRDLDEKEHFASIIYDLWYENNYDTVRKGSKLLDSFDLDKPFDTTDIPKEIQHLITF